MMSLVSNCQRLVPALALWCAGCAPALDWREVRPAEAEGLVALFPCKPTHHAREVPMPGGSDKVRVRMQVMSCDAAGRTWALSWLSAPTAEARLQVLPALSEALWRNMNPPASGMTALHPQRDDQGPVDVPGMTPHPAAQGWHAQHAWRPGVEDAQGVNTLVWHFSKGLTVYQASVWQAALRADDPDALAFMKSFNFPR